MADFERPAIGHVDHERLEGPVLKRGSQFLGCHGVSLKNKLSCRSILTADGPGMLSRLPIACLFILPIGGRHLPREMLLNLRTQEVIATSVGSRSMLDAPKKPTIPSVFLRM